MKKLLTIAALAAVTSLSYGQGYISFANGTTSKISTNGVAMGADAVGTWYYELFAAPSTQNTISTSGDPTLNGWTAVLTGTNTASAGRLLGNNRSDGSVAVPGFAAGQTADFAVMGWSANLGTDWSTARVNLAAFFAQGSNGLAANQYAGIAPTVANDRPLVADGQIYNGMFGSAAGLINGFSLTSGPIPEPTSFALVGLGAAALLIFRRRKQ